MTSVVSNATPLIYLAKAGRINLLKEVFLEAVKEAVKMWKLTAFAQKY